MTIVEIPLRRRDGSVRVHAIVDAADEALVNQWTWRLASSGYAARNVTGRTILLHRVLMGCVHGDGREVDHENRTPLDCRRENLRLATHGQNHQNTASRAGASSTYRGVSWDKTAQRWMAYATLNGKMRNLGRYAREIDADAAATAFRREHMPFSEADRVTS